MQLRCMDERNQASCNCTGRVTADCRVSTVATVISQPHFTRMAGLFYRARHLRLRNGRYAVFVMLFIGLQYYSYNKNPIRPKSRSSRILGVGYPNPVSGRKTISVHPYAVMDGEWDSRRRIPGSQEQMETGINVCPCAAPLLYTQIYTWFIWEHMFKCVETLNCWVGCYTLLTHWFRLCAGVIMKMIQTQAQHLWSIITDNQSVFMCM